MVERRAIRPIKRKKTEEELRLEEEQRTRQEEAKQRSLGTSSRTPLQLQALKQGVPLEAFKREGEDPEEFRQRATGGEKTFNETARRELIEQRRIELEQALLNATPGQQATELQQPDQSQDSQLSQTGQQSGKPTQPNTGTSLQNQEEGVLKPGEKEFLPGLREGINELGGVPGIGQLPPQAGIVGGVQGILGVTAKITDAVRTAITGKSSKQLAASEEVMNTYMSALSQDIELYRQGVKSFDEVNQNIKQAEASISQYERNLVGEGRRNLNFWVDKGARIEANIILQRDRINDFKATLINAGSQNV